MKNEDLIKDWRSTGRRRARRVLFASNREFKCEQCKRTTTEPPKDAPDNFDELWPLELRVLTPQSIQAQHKTKDVRDNDEEFLSWMCSRCHKLEDLSTNIGVSVLERKTFY